MLVVVNLDPHSVRATTLALDMPALGLDWDDTFTVRDELTGADLRVGPAALRPARPVHASRAHPDRHPQARTPQTEDVHVSIAEYPDDSSPAQPRDPIWYKRAVFYEVLIRGFYDSNGDGTGDIRGLTQKLDYLQWLGVDCIWLLPIFQSPLRDGGYDISDYMQVLPEFGDLGDFVQLVDAAHARGMRIIADLVMNHTSDAHPWFQASRSDPTGPYGDFYVWSDTDDALPGRPDHLRRHREVQLDLGSRTRAVLLAPVLQPPARPQLRQPAGPARPCSRC